MKLRKTELEVWVESTRMLEARLVPINPAYSCSVMLHRRMRFNDI